MGGDRLTERWLIAAELSVVLQVLSLIFLYQVGTGGGNVAQRLALIGGVILFVPIVFVISTMAVWQDIQGLNRHTAYGINGLLWIAVVVFLPIVGTAGYAWKYSQNPTYRGVIGRLVSYKRDDELDNSEFKKESDQASGDNSGSIQSSSDSTSVETSTKEIINKPNFGTGETNELPNLETLEQIASDGYTEVSRMAKPEEDVTVVKKSPRLSSTVSKSVKESLIHEATTWEKIDDHDHIVSVYGWGGTPYPWMLLEDIQGGDFREVIENQGVEMTIKLLAQVCKGVYHGHERGVYHFDLKPSNILLENNSNTAKVTDWGSARVFMNEDYSSQELTPAYTSPELINTNSYSDPSPQTDIFQVGILAYESLTGVHPFRQDSTNECTESIKNTTPRPPSEIEPSLTPEIDQTIMKALRKDPDERHSTLLQFSGELTGQVKLSPSTI